MAELVDPAEGPRLDLWKEREKLKVLAENHAEAAQVLRDAFEDAVLMGVDEAAMRRILTELVQALPSPRRGKAAAGG